MTQQRVEKSDGQPTANNLEIFAEIDYFDQKVVMVGLLQEIEDREQLLGQAVVFVCRQDPRRVCRPQLGNFALLNNELRAELLLACNVVNIVFVGELGELDDSTDFLGIIESLGASEFPVLNEKLAIHEGEILGIAVEVVLDIFDVVDFEDDQFVDGIPEAVFAFGFDFRQFLADLRVFHHVVVDAGVVGVDCVTEAVLFFAEDLLGALSVAVAAALGHVPHIAHNLLELALTCVEAPQFPLHGVAGFFD